MDSNPPRPSRIETVRTLLILAIVFLVSVLFTGLIIGPVITVLFYFFWHYYRRTKYLEKKLADMTSMPSGTRQIPHDEIPPPAATDA
jgi:heme/copper-type cytochrome/quinol oxidase subunit 2